jgi:hypothetical protein
MLDIFSNRNKMMTNIMKLGTYLGRSLRENVKLLTVDSTTNQVCYLTQSGKLIDGTFTPNSLTLNNIIIKESSVVSDEDKFNTFVNAQVSKFVRNIYEDKYNEANVEFNDILTFWEDRFKLKNLQRVMSEKSSFISEKTNILNTPEYKNFKEVLPLISQYIRENFDSTLTTNLETSVRKVAVTAQAFNLNKISFEQLQEMKSYKVNEKLDTSVYDVICKHELLKQELLESKRSFEHTWATSEKMKNLVKMIGESDENKIELALVEAVTEIPFLAMASKGQLASVVEKCIELDHLKAYKQKEIKEYSSKIFEMKKPIRSALNKILSEKYQINVLNLKEPVSLKSLAENCAEVFGILADNTKSNKVVHSACVSMNEMLKSKGGIESLDVNQDIYSVFQGAGVELLPQTYKISEQVDIKSIFTESFNAKEVITSIKEKLLKEKKIDEYAADDEDVAAKDVEIPPVEISAEEHDELVFRKNMKELDDLLASIQYTEVPKES